MEITDFYSIAGDKRRAGSLMTNVYGVRCRKCLWRRRNKIAGQERSDNGRWRKFAGEDLEKIAGEDCRRSTVKIAWRWKSLLKIWRRSSMNITAGYLEIEKRKLLMNMAWWWKTLKENRRRRSDEDRWWRLTQDRWFACEDLSSINGLESVNINGEKKRSRSLVETGWSNRWRRFLMKVSDVGQSWRRLIRLFEEKRSRS